MTVPSALGDIFSCKNKKEWSMKKSPTFIQFLYAHYPYFKFCFKWINDTFERILF